MNRALTIDDAVRAERYSPVRFDAFRVVKGLKADRTYAVDIGGYLLPDLAAAQGAALIAQAFDHKDHLVIRETDDLGERLHIYAIKRRSAARFVHRHHITERVRDLYAAHVCTINARELNRQARDDLNGSSTTERPGGSNVARKT